MSCLSYVKEQNPLLSGKKIFTDLQTRDHVLMNKIIKYYENSNNIILLQKITNNKSKLSLRIIDYFVTNYAKEKEVIYDVKNEKFMVYHSYKSQLKAYSKKQFDPFCRRDRIILSIDKNNTIKTTVGQLNFFRWAITNNILNHIKNNYEDIEKEMNLFSKKYKSTKKNKNVKKNKNITIIDNNLQVTATKKVNLHNVTITVKFN